MPKKHRPLYPLEFRLVSSMARAGRTPESLAEDFEPTAQCIRNWVKQADLDEGKRGDGLATEERAELARLRRENRELREEKEILGKFAAWSARHMNTTPPKRSGS